MISIKEKVELRKSVSTIDKENNLYAEKLNVQDLKNYSETLMAEIYYVRQGMNQRKN